MPLKQQRWLDEQERRGEEGLAQPLIPVPAAGTTTTASTAAARSASFVLPTPFRNAAPASGGGEGGGGLPPAKKAGGVLRDKHGKYRTLYDQRARTTVLVNPQYVGRSFRASPRQLGFITLACALVQAVCAPIGGLLGHYLNRAHVMAAGCFVWGVMAIGFAFTNTVATGMSFWAFNGVGLGLLLPNAQSLIADYFSALSRGKAFGALYLTSALGGMLGALFATNMGHTHPFGMQGWRVAFITGKRGVRSGGQDPDLMAVATPRAMLADISSVLAVPSFVIVVTQGIVGSTPWNALVFNTLYLQLLGFSDFQSSLLGGFIGDWAARRHPSHGRVAVAQVSVGLGVPLSIAVFKLLPMGSSGGIVALYGVAFTIWGLMISWAGAACTSPIFAEVVPSQLRSLVYSFDRAFEGGTRPLAASAVAACGAPVVGWLAERLGFNSAEGGGGQTDAQRAQALGDAIVICTAVPWALCCLLYSGLHVTYPRDRRLALRSQRTRSGYAPPLPSLPMAPSAEVWEATPSDSPTAAQAAGTVGPRVSFIDGRPGE
ncbi:hypothetical protein CHLNCDRAFT_138130 [Chlorella variabilis]|uniref:Major facilitator superfamily (MFS) profile domain-containing protein n=1 Tax=Chlorella variabilis TaxID=554065 RepID=E1Z5C0_CHLVA|nr:hypothetical protein CHLNCDRAFT_138130 [Chlorella variabilis]EFN59499.1 hypothetical protein CHLNCDRAFT_138130 [Chlorella variabilis]|eukprot:XP_005851601.1 hypothetical protein CHLNCDRAFT_138130 [Chlorella variabilis]